MRFKGWRAPITKVAVTVYGPHPFSENSQGHLDALFGLGMAGRSGAVRTNPDSPYTSRFNGDGGRRVQPFTPRALYGQANAGLRTAPSSLPNTAGGTSSTMLDALGRAGI